MLGTYISSYFGDNSICYSRYDLDASKESVRSLYKKLKIYQHCNVVVVNCIGIIKPEIKNNSFLNVYRVNTSFPRKLAKVCNMLQFKLIHPTTDCIYDGKRGKYVEGDASNVYDLYGLSKRFGENDGCTVIRTSIIGEEIHNKRSLVEWVKSNKGGEINGFENHLWNGITCLQFAKIVENIITKF